MTRQARYLVLKKLGFCVALLLSLPVAVGYASEKNRHNARSEPYGPYEPKAKLPPLGERKYILDEKTPYAPVAIQGKDKVVKETFLKDPMKSTGQMKPARTAHTSRSVAVPKKEVKSLWQPTQLRFAKLAVRGHLNRPRVDFNRDILPIGRADEPVRQDFFNRVFEPARDDNF